MKRLPTIGAGFITFGSISANAKDRAVPCECYDADAEVVEQTEPSVHDAADLFVDVICLDQAVAPENEMLGTRKNVVDLKGHGSASSDFMSVMKREANGRLFDVRKERLGL